MAPEAVVPDVVYHYTSVETMTKISSTGIFRATSIDYLNDTSEGKHFIDQIARRLDDYEDSDCDDIRIEMSKPGNSDLPFNFKPFVASFSTENDSLAQWRSYCPNGNGVAIGFKSNCLKRVRLVGETESSPMGAFFSAITYTEAERPVEEIDREIELIINGTNSFLTMAAEHERGKSLKRAFVFRVLASFWASFKKHISFAHEHEYRIALNPTFLGTNLHYGFQCVRTTLVPYLEVNIPKKLEGYEGHEFQPSSAWSVLSGRPRVDFIDRVVIGPTPNMKLTRQAVEGFLASREIDAEVCESKIPYREW